MKFRAAVILAENTKRFMEARKWTQRELAKRAGISQRGVSYVLNYRDDGDRHATLETVECLAGAFGLRTDQLLIEGVSTTVPQNLLSLVKRTKVQPHNESRLDTVDTDLLRAILDGAMKLRRRTSKQKAELVSKVYAAMVSGHEARTSDNIVRLLRSA